MGNAHPKTGISPQSIPGRNRLSSYGGEEEESSSDQKSPLLLDSPREKKKMKNTPPPPVYLLSKATGNADVKPRLVLPDTPDNHRLADRIVISQLKLRVSILEFMLKKQGNDLDEIKLHKSATDQKVSHLIARIDDIANNNNNNNNNISASPTPSSAAVPDLIDMVNDDDDFEKRRHQSLLPFDSLIGSSDFPVADCVPIPVHGGIDWDLHITHFSYLLFVFLISLFVGFLL